MPSQQSWQTEWTETMRRAHELSPRCISPQRPSRPRSMSTAETPRWVAAQRCLRQISAAAYAELGAAHQCPKAFAPYSRAIASLLDSRHHGSTGWRLVAPLLRRAGLLAVLPLRPSADSSVAGAAANTSSSVFASLPALNVRDLSALPAAALSIARWCHAWAEASCCAKNRKPVRSSPRRSPRRRRVPSSHRSRSLRSQRTDSPPRPAFVVAASPDPRGMVSHRRSDTPPHTPTRCALKQRGGGRAAPAFEEQHYPPPSPPRGPPCAPVPSPQYSLVYGTPSNRVGAVSPSDAAALGEGSPPPHYTWDGDARMQSSPTWSGEAAPPASAPMSGLPVYTAISPVACAPHIEVHEEHSQPQQQQQPQQPQQQQQQQTLPPPTLSGLDVPHSRVVSGMSETSGSPAAESSNRSMLDLLQCAKQQSKSASCATDSGLRSNPSVVEVVPNEPALNAERTHIRSVEDAPMPEAAAPVPVPLAGSDPVAAWLGALGLSGYAAIFKEHEVDMEVVHMLTAGDLTQMGISPDDRITILSATQQQAV